MTTKGGLAAMKEQQNKAVATAQNQSVAAVFNSLLDSEGYRNRIQEIMKDRAPQFVASLVEMVNGSPALMDAFREAPVTIIRSALRAAAYDLPIDQGLGYAYVVPFNNKVGDNQWRHEAAFLLGYKGMLQLAIRTGVYSKINVIDVREGELKSYNRLTEDIDIEFIDDETERNKKKIIGYVGYYRLVNGMEKTIYMTKEAIEAHEEKFRKGKYQSKGWKENWESMASKTVLRKLIGKWGIMSVNYQKASPDMVAFAEAAAKGELDDEDVAEQAIETTATEAPAFEEVPKDEKLTAKEQQEILDMMDGK